MASVTVEELDLFIAEMAVLRSSIEQDKEALSIQEKLYAEMGQRAAKFLEELGRTSYKSQHGTVIRKEAWRYSLPKTEEDREAFFQYLKDKGVFDQLITVNSNTYNSFIRAEVEAADDPMAVSIPGVPAAQLYVRCDFLKGKE
jgi:hypothetical protein